MPNLSDRLLQLKAERQLLQKDIANAIGVSLRAYQYYERGERNPDSETLSKLADFFDVSTDYLLGRVNYQMDADGNITVKAPPDIFNLDTDELKKKLGQD